MMNSTDRLERIRKAQATRRRMQKLIREERDADQLVGFAFAFAGAMDSWIPCRGATRLVNCMVRRRIRRRTF